jgi:hypothetical protein
MSDFRLTATGTVVCIILSAGALQAADVTPPLNISIQIGGDSVTVGDRVPLLLRITHPDSVNVLPVEQLKKTGDVYILGGPKRGAKTQEGEVLDSLFALVVPFRTGSVTVPSFNVFYQTSGGKTDSVATDSAFVYVKSVLPPNAKDIKGLKPNIRAPTDVRSYVLLGLIACALGAAVFFTVRLLRKRRRAKPSAVPVVPPKLAHEIAFEELLRIASLNLLSQGKIKEYYSLISETLRKYIGNRYSFETLDLTTFELAREMSKRDIPRSSAEEFRSFLARSDLVKFAKFVPSCDEMESAIEVVRELVKKTMLVEEVKEPVQSPEAEVVRE